MKRSIILTLALFATVSLQAQYLFVNATGNLLKGYTIEVKSSSGTRLATIENGQSAYVMEATSYQLVAFNEKHQKGKPLNFTVDKKDAQKKVFVVEFGKFLNHVKVNQTTLEQAKKAYEGRVSFPK